MATRAFADLAEVEAYLEAREDVIDGDYGEPAPNEEMNRLRDLRDATKLFAELVTAASALLAAASLSSATRVPFSPNSPAIAAARVALARVGSPQP